ncbi:hypothetical protein FOPG_15862 [Fusarium oxysporum f. sp. conglutinans race 2 54008]|uniref:Uncharacterized protein n=1 Tax=Fusarium oxysporum f. sp. conglutinans race 2 54008 TaxID=1089457 RepID=X0H853_FUSOX|nr:hypothetical protein FOPG_15862 [Fusarium oxysporum f. sp. conglutinans race 2 54008]
MTLGETLASGEAMAEEETLNMPIVVEGGCSGEPESESEAGSVIEYSVDLIRKCRQNNVVTPFFRSVLYGEEDGYLGRPLTDSETVVGIQNYTIHRWEAAFPDPESFIPDRWLDDKNIAQRKEAFVPFSVGSRKCIGINLAQMELSKLVAAFFRRFDATIDPSTRPEDMRMFDNFSAGPVGRKLLIRFSESSDPVEISHINSPSSGSLAEGGPKRVVSSS